MSVLERPCIYEMYCKVKERKDSSLSEYTLVKYSISLIVGSVMCFLRKCLSYHYLLKNDVVSRNVHQSKNKKYFLWDKNPRFKCATFLENIKTLNLIKCTFSLLLVLIFIMYAICCMRIHGVEFDFQSITPWWNITNNPLFD